MVVAPVKSLKALIRTPRFSCPSIQASFHPPTRCQPSEQSYRWYWLLVVSDEGVQNRTNTYHGQGILLGTPRYNIYNSPKNDTNGKIFHQLKVSFHSGYCPKWFTSGVASLQPWKGPPPPPWAGIANAFTCRAILLACRCSFSVSVCVCVYLCLIRLCALTQPSYILLLKLLCGELLSKSWHLAGFLCFSTGIEV